jgi:hypothetical protein
MNQTFPPHSSSAPNILEMISEAVLAEFVKRGWLEKGERKLQSGQQLSMQLTTEPI